MRNNLSSVALIMMLIIFPIGTLFAGQDSTIKNEKSYVVKITSENSNTPVNFAGEMMQMTVDGPSVTPINDVTPFEGVVTTNFLNVMLHTVSPSAAKIKVQLIDRNKNLNDVIVSGNGSAVFVHVNAKGDGYVNSQ